MSCRPAAQKSYSVPEGVLSEVVDGEAVLLHLDSGKYFGLNRTATRIWQLLAGQMAEAEVTAIISQEFSVDEQTARRDISSLVDDLTQRGLLSPRAHS